MTYNVPFKVSLRDYEGMMNSREYWDDLGAEWSWNTIEKKLGRLAGFVQQGGNLKKVINRYAKDHDERYNLMGTTTFASIGNCYLTTNG